MGNEIKDLIQQLAGTYLQDKVHLFDAEIISVDETARTCVVQMIGGESSNEIIVRLMASVDDGSFIIPKVGSTVVVSMSDHLKPFVSMFSEVEKIIWLGGEYEGVPIVKHPSNSNKGILKKINNLENLVNDLISKYNAHTHTSACTAGGSTTVPTTSIETQTIAPITAQSDIEHPLIKH
jgi:hypothetical protein